MGNNNKYLIICKFILNLTRGVSNAKNKISSWKLLE